MEAVLELNGLTKIYPNRRGVENISLQVQRGDIYGFFGPNGAGKTTVMKIIAGLCRADRGQVRLFGQDASADFVKAMSKVGVLIETADAYDYMSGYKNLELAARFYPQLPRKRIDEVLELVGLAPFKHEKVSQYSLGMKQRLGVAAAILSEPELLILDEPTNGLDIEGMVEMRELIARLAHEQHITFFLSSHLITEMEQLCSRIGILYNGRLIREDFVADIVRGANPMTLENYFMEQVREERRAEVHA
ncbi:ABC transporter ATP-binding protein [Paenibacillus tyrfis]|uniref:ABC transporter ATP-binding protein n=1 Tax=Paenibacillus tyrfis TaxID=1501230 RepID=UPI000B590A17|nr:ATP-binding cassette domain-containing protein [Paenibacillus tyrfis]